MLKIYLCFFQKLVECTIISFLNKPIRLIFLRNNYHNMYKIEIGILFFCQIANR